MVSVTFRQHLELEQMDGALARAEAELTPGAGLLVDCREMTGYDAAARERFVEWNSAHRDVIPRVAVVTDNVMYRMIVSTMALVSKQSMRAFQSPVEAEAWLDEGGRSS